MAADQQSSPGKLFFGGLFLFGFAYGLNWVLNGLESGAIRSVRMPVVIIVVYELLGRTVTVAIPAVLGAISIFAGIVEFFGKPALRS